jgi:hypothetical protein
MSKNCYNFKNYDLRHLKIYLDGQLQTLKPLEANFAAGQYITSYLSLFGGTGKLGKDEGSDITRTDFPAGYSIYGFDLSPDLAETGHFNLHREGSVRVEIKFGTALPATINVIVYGEFENVMEIDRSKNILFDYNN